LRAGAARAAFRRAQVAATSIHPTAIVAKAARLGEGVVVGPYAVIEDGVEIGDGCDVGPHAVIHGGTRIGARNRIHAHAVLGGAPQDLSFRESDTWLVIGDDNVLREGVTAHRATRTEAPTRIGSHCFFMAYAHVAHDCRVGDRVILTNNVCLGGHVEVGDQCTIGGAAGVHQFVRIGTQAMVAAHAVARKDVLPYTLAGGEPMQHYRLNTVGLRRRGVTGERYRALESAFRALREGGDLSAVEATPEVEFLRAWLARPSKRGLHGFAQA
jgi:UDP-N-acetylglucosamine acyltransferase